jgi:hypothetical protein
VPDHDAYDAYWDGVEHEDNPYDHEKERVKAP